MKLSLLTLAIFIGYNSYSQNDRNSFNAGIEAGFAFTTIQPYEKYLGFWDDIDNGKTTNPRVGIFVNRFISDYHQLEFGIYYTEKGTAYYRHFALLPIVFASDNNGKSLNYLEIPLSLNYYPFFRSSFCYTFGLSYLMLENETRDSAYKLYNDFDVEASIGIRSAIDKFDWMNKFLLSAKFGFSVIPISNNQQVGFYNINKNRNVRRSLNARNYALAFSLLRYL